MDTPAPFFVNSANFASHEKFAPQAGRPAKAIRVLLIEDNLGDARLIKEFLAESPGVPFDVEYAGRLTSAVERLSQKDYDVVLLDLSLPESRGLDTLLKVQTHTRKAPIVVLSGTDDARLASLAVQSGAQDYLLKGHVESHSLVRSMHYAIERTRRRRAEEALRSTQEEFRVARDIQQQLYPSSPLSHPGFDICGASIPALAAGGDYFDYFPMPDGRVAVAIGDVSGHGVGPAMLMATTRAYLRALALTNRALFADLGEDHFITLLLARLDLQRSSLVYVSAGHPTCYVLGPSGSVTRELNSTAMPLGLVTDYESAASQEIELNPGETVLLLTDGVLETGGFSVDQALDVVHANRRKSAREIAQTLNEAARASFVTQSHQDDITSIVIKVEERDS
jgi:serine phosphatase RsbU (regulator of sigma subunit)